MALKLCHFDSGGACSGGVELYEVQNELGACEESNNRLPARSHMIGLGNQLSSGITPAPE